MTLIPTMTVLLGLAAFALTGNGTSPATTRFHEGLPDGTADTLRIDSTIVRIDLDQAIPIALQTHDGIEPAAFTTRDGRHGWALKIPGGRPIATPAYADGMIFVGGGYGSYEFYAFDAATGKLVWKIKTADDGPSAAVVEEGYVAFNTESCTVIVVEATTGRIVWQEWLGDPLMSQPAIANGRLYIAHPAGGRHGGLPLHSGAPLHNGSDQSSAMSTQHHGFNAEHHDLGAQHAGDTPVAASSSSHRMLCADLRTGTHLWSTPISSDVITAPVLDSNRVYITCFDGTSYCLDAGSGNVVWRRENAGTSAPLVADGSVVMTAKQDRGGVAYEGIVRMDWLAGVARDSGMIAAGEARYLNENGGGGVAIDQHQVNALDQSVGFGVAPQAAQLERANKHLGIGTVAGGWAYQGSRAAYNRGQLMNAQGRYLNSIDAKDGRMQWRAEARGEGIADGMQLFSPPALGDIHLYLATARGHLAAVRQDNGTVAFMYRMDHPAAFQPALAAGRMYVGTVDGWLICLETGLGDTDGWYAWGGNAQHNKK